MQVASRQVKVQAWAGGTSRRGHGKWTMVGEGVRRGLFGVEGEMVVW